MVFFLNLVDTGERNDIIILIISMKKNKNVSVSNPDELNKYLQHTSISTWVGLGLVTAILLSFFVWSFIYKIKIRLSGNASITGGVVSLTVNDSDLDKLKVGQYVYISNLEGKITSIKDDGQPVVSNFALDNGEYTYSIVIREMRPIDFLIGK